MALEVVTDGKNDRTEKNDSEYVHNKRTWDRTCFFLCVCATFFCINDNKCILSCAVIKQKHRRTENETVMFIFS